MGFNVAGILIDRNYQQDLPSLERILGVRLVLEGEVPYEEASENYKEGDYCDVYFCEQGTIVYTNAEFTLGKYVAKGQKVLAFTWYEISDAFYFRYSEDGMVKRTKMVAEGEVSLDEGEPLPEELRLAEQEGNQEFDNTPELIVALFRAMIGQSFDEIAPDSKCYRYRIVREEDEEREEDILPVVESVPPLEAEVIIQNKERRRKQNRIALGVFLGLLILFRILVYIVYKQ